MKKNYVICRTCGYVMEESKLHDVCPVCGVPAKVFIPYTSKVNEKRERILGLHLHPIILHFPQAVVTFSFLLLILLPFLKGDWKEYATICAKFNVFLLPLCIIGGVLTGILDGKVRYKKLSAPYLKLKIVFSIVFFAISVVAALVMLLAELTLGVNLLLIVLMLGGLGSSLVLGRTGAKLMGPIFPG